MIIRLPYPAVVAATGTTWNPADANSNVVFSSDKRTISYNNSGGWYGTRSTTSKTSGRYAVAGRFITNTGGNSTIMGISNSSGNLNDYPGSNSNTIGFWDNGGQWLGGSGGSNTGTLADGDWVVFDVNIDAKTIAASRQGGAYTSPRSFSFAGPYFVIGSLDNGPAVLQGDWAGTACPYAPPSGVPWWG